MKDTFAACTDCTRNPRRGVPRTTACSTPGAAGCALDMTPPEPAKAVILAALEEARAFWVKVAKDNGWYKKRIAANPNHAFYVNIWMNGRTGEVTNSIYQMEQSLADCVQFSRHSVWFRNGRRLKF